MHYIKKYDIIKPVEVIKMKNDKRKPKVEYRGKTTVDEKTYIKIMATLKVFWEEYKREIIATLIAVGVFTGAAIGFEKLNEEIEKGNISIIETTSSDNREEFTDEDYLMQFFDDQQISIMDGSDGFYVSGRNPKQLTYDEVLEKGYEELVLSSTMSLDSFCKAWHKCTGARIFSDWKKSKETLLESRHKLALSALFDKYGFFIMDGSDGFFVSGENPEGLTYDQAIDLAYEELVVGKQMSAEDFADTWHELTGAKISKNWLKDKQKEFDKIIINNSSVNRK